MQRDHGDEQDNESAASERELKEEILVAIAAHLREHGRHNWNLLRERPEFAAMIGAQSGETGRRKFFHWVKSVSKPVPADTTRPHEGRAIADDAYADAAARAQAAAERLPAAPSPAFFMKMGADADVKVTFVEAMDEIWADIQRVREDSLESDGSGGFRVRSSKALNESAKNRLTTLSTAVRLTKEIYDLDALHRQYKAIIDIIVSLLAGVPDLQAQVLDRLKEANDTQAMTPFAEVRL